MKLNGEFVVRQVMDQTVAIPVGSTALEFNGMVMLNSVSRVIWQCLEQDTQPETIVKALTDAFTVSEEEARSDTLEFLDKLRSAGLLEE